MYMSSYLLSNNVLTGYEYSFVPLLEVRACPLPFHHATDF